ncbi:MAG: hypothetical protein ACYDEH_05290 [Acidimicrobiales bacterium]
MARHRERARCLRLDEPTTGLARRGAPPDARPTASATATAPDTRWIVTG